MTSRIHVNFRYKMNQRVQWTVNERVWSAELEQYETIQVTKQGKIVKLIAFSTVEAENTRTTIKQYGILPDDAYSSDQILTVSEEDVQAA